MRGIAISSGLRHRLLLLAAALLFSTGGAAIKAATLTPWQVASFRSAVAAVALVTLIPGARRGWRPAVAVAALPYAATMVGFVLATRLTTAANAIFLQSTAPFFLLLLGPFLLGERIRRADFAFLAAVMGGMAMFSLGTEHSTLAPDPRTGNWIAAATGLTWALTVAGLRWTGRGDGNAAPVVLAGNVLACLVALPMALPVAHMGAADVTVIAYLGIFQIGLAYVCLTRGLRAVPAFEASTLLLIEPALNPVWAWLMHGETPSVWAAAGGVTILAATLVHSIAGLKPRF
jgi:drug/metabolite transporter (DMT)-like permease